MGHLFEQLAKQAARVWGTRFLKDSNISWGDVILWVGFGVVVLAAAVVIVRLGMQSRPSNDPYDNRQQAGALDLVRDTDQRQERLPLVSASSNGSAMQGNTPIQNRSSPRASSVELQHRADELQDRLNAHRIALAEIEEKDLRTQLARRSGIAKDIADVARIMWSWPAWTENGWIAPDAMLVVRSSIASRHPSTADRRIMWFRDLAFSLEIYKSRNLLDDLSNENGEQAKGDSAAIDDTAFDRIVLTSGDDHQQGNQQVVLELKAAIYDSRKGVRIETFDERVDVLVPGPWMLQISNLAIWLRQLEAEGYPRGWD